jgi:hypothetical protein
VIARALLIVAAVSAATACGAQSSGATGASGLAGVVRISPAVPVCRIGKSCSRPAKGFRLVFSRNGRQTVVTTDSHGRYRVKLDRGRYVVHAATRPNTAPRHGLQPSRVTVPRGRVARRDFTYDSGIR